MKKITSRQRIVLNILISALFIIGCREQKTENRVEDSLKNLSKTMDKGLNKLNTEGEKKTKEFGKKIEQGANVIGDKAADAIDKLDKKANEVIGSDENNEKGN